MIKQFLRLTFIICIVICTAFVFVDNAGAVGASISDFQEKQPNASATIDELNIIPDYAVLEGQTKQMQVEEFDEFIMFSSVEWSSNNPEIISCTKDGVIKGLQEGKATITVKAKVGDATDKITVYCAKKLNSSTYSRSNLPIVWTCKTPFF